MAEAEEEYDPSKPYAPSSFHTSPPSANPAARLPPPPPTLPVPVGNPFALAAPPPPPTLPFQTVFNPSNGAPPPPPPPPPTFFAGAPPPPFLGGGGPPPPPPGGFPPFQPTLARPPPTLPRFPPPAPTPAPTAVPGPSKDLSAYLNPPKPPTIFGPPKVGLEISHIPKPRAPKGAKAKAKKSAGGTIQDNLRHALYQDEKYTLHEPVWKVVAGLMTRVHYIETSPTKLPITKLIATKKSDAISMHKRLLEKSTAAIYYSDGSFKNGWAWGAAVEWVRTPGQKEGTVGRKLREELGMCDPTDAEMGGMRKALEAFASAGKLREEELLIFSDSQAAITLLDSGIRYQSQLFISTLERTLTLHPNVKVSIVWIPGHVGITGNELADRTAVAGSTTTVLARRGGVLPGGASAVVAEEGPKDMPIILSRTVQRKKVDGGPGEEGEVGEEEGKMEDALLKDDSLTFGAGSLFVARFPEAATSGDLEVLFGQFGQLTSIDIISIPPLDDRFAIVSFSDPKMTEEAIQWLDDKPVTLPSRYAETRDCEVWKGWQGTLRLAHNEVGRLVPAAIASLYPLLPEWALTGRTTDDDAGSGGGGPEDFKDDFEVETTPQSGQANRRDPRKRSRSPVAARPSFVQPSPPRPPPSNLPEPLEEMTPSERFLIGREIFPPGPGNRVPKKARNAAAGANGRYSATTASTPAPPPPSTTYHPPPRSNNNNNNSQNSFPPRQGLNPPVASSSSYRNDPPPPPPPSSSMPTSIAEMTRLITDLKACAVLLDDQHDRLSVVLRDPADWSLAVAHLGQSILREQEALENARRIRAKAEDDVAEWEAVLQRNEVGIEERRGFVLDVLDVLDSGMMDQSQLVVNLRSQNQTKTLDLIDRMRSLPPTTHSVLQSFEHLFTTLHNALEDQRLAIDEAERRSSVLGGLIQIRREARGAWRDRRQEIDLVVRELTRPAGPPAGPPPMRDERMFAPARDERGMSRGGEDPRMMRDERGAYAPPPPPPMMHDERYRERDGREYERDPRRR